MKRVVATLAIAAGAWSAGPAGAVSIVAVTPQGEVAQVRQVTVKFSEAVVPFGDPRLPDPLAIACQGGVPAGSGRWANDRVWLYDFRAPLGPGASCTATVRGDWKPTVKGAGGSAASAATAAPALAGPTRFVFSTGGPAIVSIQPGGGSDIEEDQHFLLRLNGAAVEATVVADAWCEVEGIGERIALRVVGGDVRQQILKARRIDDKAEAERTLVARCERPLPNGAAMRLVWGKGIAAASNPKVVSTIEQRFRYAVRAAFTAEFTCERERANAPCLPIRPMSVRFSAAVPRELAAQVRLRPAAGGEPLAPVFDRDDKATELTEIAFPKPLAENAAFSVEMPATLRDNAGRPLANAAAFPLKVQTGGAPPIAKFAAAPFGIVERYADAALPVTLRHVQADLRPVAGAASGAGAAQGQVRVKRLSSDADILAWFARLQKYHETQMTARELGLPERDWYTIEEETNAKGRVVRRRVERSVGTREISLLAKEPGATRLELPQLAGGDPRPFEVVGIPLPEPGYHVVEIESLRLGQSLLDKRAPMYVRTGVLVTNLGVHFKLGRENSVVWVTSLDRGQPVEGADIVVNDCDGKPLWRGRSDAKGLAVVDHALEPNPDECVADGGYFVSARRADAKGGATDVAFVFSSWQKGIEPWRFNVPTGRGAEPDLRAATVFDRTLFRAGETVSMKHFVRLETSRGLVQVPPGRLPTRLKIVHQGSGQEIVLPLSWRAGGRSALTTWNIPPAAKLGVYDVVLERDPPPGGASENEEGGRERSWTSGNFRVEEFRLPLVDARMSGPKAPAIAASSVAVDVHMSYFSGGAMASAPLRASALLKTRSPSFAGYDEFSFEPARDLKQAEPESSDSEESERDAGGRDGRLIADKVPLTTDRNGIASFALQDLPQSTRPAQIDAEVTFNDPNGETQTAATRIDLWPSALVLGVKAGSWASNRGRAAFSVVALDTQGKPIRGQSVAVRGRVSQVITTRKRIVGGFYAYDNRTDVKDLGELCAGTTDEHGLLACTASLDSAGQVELIARGSDAQGHAAEAASSVWVTRQGELWFAQDNDDRIDVLPEKKRYEPGETARLQVRMPFRAATALLAIEREGVIATRVVTLRGDDPTIELKIEPTWGPNVYVSVLALRGRIRETPWYSFFTWGWKEPLAWWQSFRHDGRDYQPPTAMIDLAKPAFKLGVAKIAVGLAAHELQVRVSTDKAQYLIRDKAIAKVRVTQGGKPLAGAEVAFAAVDEGLLALRGNDSWQLLEAMMKERAWGVETSTAQSEIIGRRHYGKKAVAAGGGGGRGATRELFDTLLVWQPAVMLDGNGEATIEVPLNDSLTSFRLVAIADADVQKFGTGSTSIRVTQDLQVLAGLPPLVREGDRFAAMLTLRNTTAQRDEGARHAAGHSQPAGRGRRRDRPRADGGAAGAGRRRRRRRGQGGGLADRRSRRCVQHHLGGSRRSDGREGPAQGHPAGRSGRAGARAAGDHRPARRPIRAADRRPRRCAARRRRQARRHPRRGPAQAHRRPARHPPLLRDVPVHLSRAEDVEVGRPQGRRALGRCRQRAADLPRRRRARELLPAAWRRAGARQRPAHRLRARGDARSGVRAADSGSRRDARRTHCLRRGPHRAPLLVAATRPGRAQDRRPRGAVALRPDAAEDARLGERRAQHLADGGGDRLAVDPEARRCDSRPRSPPRRSAADPARPPHVCRHDAEVQQRGGRLLVVADGQRRCQCGAPHPGRARRARLEGRPAADDRRQPLAAARRRLADDDGQPLGLARARQVLGALRVDAGRRPHGRVARRRERGQHGGLERGAHRRRLVEAGRRRLDPAALACRRRDARRRSGGHGQAVAHGAEPGRDSAQVAAARRLLDRAQRQRRRAEEPVDVVARRRRQGASRDRGAERHDLGRRQRSGARRRHHPRQRPRPRFAARDPRREARGQRLAGLRGARLRGVPQLLRIPAARPPCRRVHGASQQPRPLRPAADARRGDVFARDVRRDAERRHRGGAVNAAPRALLALAVALAATAAQAMPTFAEVKAAHRPSDVTLVDRHGEPLQTVRIDKSVRRLAWTPLAEMSPALLAAIVLSEDRRFWEHGGVDWQAAATSAWANLWNTRTRGASTVTMQLAGLLDDGLARPSGGRSVGQKVGQAWTATRLEKAWKKSEILEAYLNSVPYRGEIVGIDALAQTLFGKHPSGLDAQEAAIAAALVRSPNAKAADVAERACGVLRLQRLDCVGIKGLAETSLARRGGMPLGEQLAPHFARRTVDPGGPPLQASPLDARLQRFAAMQLRRHLAELAGRNVEDGAVVVLDNRSGEVLAWVGSSGDLSGAAEVDGVLARRQPGSTLKPFVYELAFEQRLITPATLIDDSPAQIATGGGLYLPQDYDHAWKGFVSARTALGASLNVPAVRVGAMVGTDALLARLNALGLALPQSAGWYGASLALGSADVSLLALTNAYRALANGGRFATPVLAAGAAPPAMQVADAAATFLVVDILADDNARVRTFGWASPLATRGFAAVKTGTSKDMRDNWCVGFTDRYTIGVWVGNAGGEAMHDVSGISGAAPVWQAIAGYLHGGAPSRPPAPPAGVVAARIAFDSRREAPRDEFFLAGSERSVQRASGEVLAGARYGIASPRDGSIFAIDPDIPPTAQRITFEGERGTWRLDGRTLGVGERLRWAPWPGRHRLELVAASGQALQAVSFEVRGAGVKSRGAAAR